ncbi:MAG: VWA domain-containing protein [Treponema sp.]|nr:VWA domain-containing protein [Candidatus Treponema caballi]
MISFEHPSAFLLLTLIPLLFILRELKVFARISFPLVLADWKGKVFEWKKGIVHAASIIADILFFAGYICIVAAFAGPTVTRQEKVFTSRGTDVLFVIDISPSMAAYDIGTSSRLDAARQAISVLASSAPGTSFGIVSMASEAALVVPPTQDLSYLTERLVDIRIGELGDGTAIGTGLSVAVYHLAGSSAPKKCIILLTDGENNAGAVHPLTAAVLAAENDIPVYSLAIGTKGAVPLEYVNPVTGKVYSGYLESGFDDSQLREIASMTGGGCYTVENISALSDALAAVLRRESVTQTYQLRTKTESKASLVLMAAAVAIMLSWIIRRVYLKELV